MRKALWEPKMCRILVITFFFSTALFFSWAVAIGNSGERDNNLNNETPQNYFFEMDKKQRETFFKKLKLIKLGDSVQKVKTILGAPTYDQTGVSKKGEFRARILEYYVRIYEKDLVNEKYDRSVWLIFNAQGVLVKIESNVDGYKTLN